MAIESKIQTTIGLCIIEVTKFLMNRYHIDQETAYKKLLATEFYSLLDDSETRLYLEPNGYLCKACALELDEGKNALYAFINQ
jgi:hypothetical protein